MKNAAGLWIDHSKAVIVIVSAEREKTKTNGNSCPLKPTAKLYALREDLKQTVPATKDSSSFMTSRLLFSVRASRVVV
jgi:hypothetical protein